MIHIHRWWLNSRTITFVESVFNSGYYLSAARRRRGRFFFPIGSGPRGSGLWNGDRDKHWVQLQFNSGSSSPGVVFFLLLDLGPGAAACGMGIEINTGYSCYLSAARRRRGRFFLLLDLGPGAAAGGMGLEINTVYSCYLSNCGRI